MKAIFAGVAVFVLTISAAHGDVNGRPIGGTVATGVAAITSGTVSGVTFSNSKKSLLNYTGTNVAINFQKNAYADTTNAPAGRFFFSSAPTAPTDTNTTSECDITWVAPPGSVITNVIDSFTVDGPWGSIISATTHLHFYWIGPALHMWQDPAIGVISPAQITANTDDWNPSGFSTATHVRFSTDASRNFTGFVGQPDGRVITFDNIGAQSAVFKASTGSATTNQIFASADIALAGKQSIDAWYDLISARWRIIGGVGSGGSGAPTGTMVSSGASITGGIPIATDATATNHIGSKVTITSLTNINTGSIVVSNATPSRLAVFGPTGSLTNSGVASTFDPNTPRVSTLTDAATVTPVVVGFDMGILTSLSQDTTIDNPATAPSEGKKYELRIFSTTARNLTYGSKYRFSFDTPSTITARTTGASHTDYIVMKYNAVDDKYDCVGKNFGF